MAPSGTQAEAFVYDHLRTPRGKGKAVGGAPRGEAGRPRRRPARRGPGPQPRRSTPNRVDDVVLGVVSPIGEQGGDIAKTAALAAGLPRDRRRRTAQPLLRLRPRGGQPGRVAGPQRLRGPDPRRRRRVDEPGADGLRRRRLGDGPGHRADHRLRAAGHRRRPDRHPRGLEPRGRRRLRRRVAPPRRQGVGQRLLRRGRRPGQGPQRRDRPRPRRADPPRHLGRGPGRAQAELRRASAADAGFDDVALEKYHWVERIDHVHHAGNSSGIVDGAALVADRHRAGRQPTSASPRGPGSSRPRSPAPTRRSC